MSAAPVGRTDWAGLYRDQAQRLASLALLHAESASDAEELLQETLCGLIVRQVSADDPVAYLVKSLRNAAATRGRRRGTAQRGLDLRAETLRSDGDGSAGCGLLDGVVRKEAIEALIGAVERLRDVQREVLLLKTRGGLTFSQIAGVLDMSANTVASHYRRALECLRDILTRELDDDDA